VCALIHPASRSFPVQAEVIEPADSKAAATSGESKSSSGSSDSKGAGSGSVGSSKAITPLVRRLIDHDNSCLFNAIGYVLDDRNRQAQETLRPLVAATILSDPRSVLLHI
jgi:ubiquitin thioesterase OTU1